MINSTDLSGKLAFDARDLNALKGAAAQNSPEALKTVAKQFEALFMNMVMKSMREATPQDGMFNNDQTKMFTSMLDQQISQNMANRGIGLADVLVRQLSSQRTVIPPDAEAKPMPLERASEGVLDGDTAPALGLPLNRQAQIAAFQEQLRMQGDSLSSITGLPGQQDLFGKTAMGAINAIGDGKADKVEKAMRAARPAHVQAFADRLGKSAEEASLTTGIPAKFMLGQAALETGWGRHEIKTTDGSNSHNVFGIKAGAGWKGKTVTATTTEYVNGVAQRRQEKFRAYDSYADSFRDYAKLLTNNPRYENVIANSRDASSFAHGLQRAGYATDPHYATKLTKLIQQNFA